MSDIRTPSSCSVSFRVNGQMVALDLPVHALLLDVLRDGLGLKGAKRSCDVQVCGACTVLVDGRRINSCLTLAVMKDGAQVTTIEGLAQGSTLHPIQQAFIEHAIDVIFVEEKDDEINPLGIKGVGEIGIVGTAAAIANAVYHATGTRVRDLPITLDKLLRN